MTDGGEGFLFLFLGPTEGAVQPKPKRLGHGDVMGTLIFSD